MENLSFSPLHVNNLSINNTYSLIKSSVDIAIPVKSALGDMINAALTKLMAANENFGQQINKNQKSELTDDLKPLDKDRDATGAEVNRTVTFYFKGSDETKKAAAQKLKSFLTPYWNAASLPLNTQTAVWSEMLGKYTANADLKAAALTLGIDGTFATLETKNNAFDAVYKSRNEEISSREMSGSSLKPAAISSYTQFVTVVEQTANLMPNETVIALFNNLDTLRKKHHLLEGGTKDASKPATTPAK